jgi:hypothetical protein
MDRRGEEKKRNMSRDRRDDGGEEVKIVTRKSRQGR